MIKIVVDFWDCYSRCQREETVYTAAIPTKGSIVNLHVGELIRKRVTSVEYTLSRDPTLTPFIIVRTESL